MKFIERWLLKLVILHFILLITVQMIFHQFHFLGQLQKITLYEGVNSNTETPIMETWNRR
ncbi:DUF5359 family protein [Heyndrickxia acidicola]|uniref:DUF5359 family protein n=1 Tax=Heyndrickxia acidicola TaxID=209389 RepID=A0ABU6MKH6_9BACI|nr:DUF5359 family protein [Heyndrickxia acidicola]MED1204892.1 DUF5359 family protein [Heyndrickxia acidicola]